MCSGKVILIICANQFFSSQILFDTHILRLIDTHKLRILRAQFIQTTKH
jgi:hypothetical protein